MWFIDCSIRFIRLVNHFATSCFKFGYPNFLSMQLLPSQFGDDCCLTWIANPWKKSRPISARWLFVTTMRSALPVFHPLHLMSKYVVPLFLIGVFVKTLKFVGFVLRLHQLFLSRSSISWAIRLVIRLFELPESTITQYLVLRDFTLSFVGVVGPSVGATGLTI